MSKEKEALDLLRSIYIVHEFCEQPLYACGGPHRHRHPHYCEDREDDFWCEGCRLAQRVAEVLGE